MKFPDFENGLVKLLGGEHASLTRAERNPVTKLMRPPSLEGTSGTEEEETKSFAAVALSKEAPKKAERAELGWIPPTSNDVERLFSRAGLVFSRLRRSMTLMTLKSMMFIQFNRCLGDASAVAEAIETERARKKQRLD